MSSCFLLCPRGWRAQEPLSALTAPLELTPAPAITVLVQEARPKPGKHRMIATFCLADDNAPLLEL